MPTLSAEQKLQRREQRFGKIESKMMELLSPQPILFKQNKKQQSLSFNSKRRLIHK